MNISGIDSAIGKGFSIPGKATEAADSSSFKDMLTSAVEEADQLYQVTEADTQALLTGQVDDLAQVMINSTKAEMSLNLIVQVRNRVVDAYNEIMRMQV